MWHTVGQQLVDPKEKEAVLALSMRRRKKVRVHVDGLDVRHVTTHHIGQSAECQRRCHAKAGGGGRVHEEVRGALSPSRPTPWLGRSVGIQRISRGPAGAPDDIRAIAGPTEVPRESKVSYLFTYLLTLATLTRRAGFSPDHLIITYFGARPH